MEGLKNKCEPKFGTPEVRRGNSVKIACQIDDTLCFFSHVVPIAQLTRVKEE